MNTDRSNAPKLLSSEKFTFINVINTKCNLISDNCTVEMKNDLFVCAERLNFTSASIQLRKAASEKKGGTLQPELRRGGLHKRPAVGFLHLLRKCFEILLLDAPRCRLSFGFIAQTQTFEGSFSAVSQPMFSSENSFCSILRYLQELHTPAAL